MLITVLGRRGVCIVQSPVLICFMYSSCSLCCLSTGCTPSIEQSSWCMVDSQYVFIDTWMKIALPFRADQMASEYYCPSL